MTADRRGGKEQFVGGGLSERLCQSCSSLFVSDATIKLVRAVSMCPGSNRDANRTTFLSPHLGGGTESASHTALGMLLIDDE
jgi:hypothetical protein